MKRRLFSILLALSMALAMLPAAAFAKPVSFNGEIIIENFGWLFLNNDEVGYYIPGKSERFRSIPPDSGPYLKVTKTGENEITITVFGNVTLQGKKALSANDENAIKSKKNLIITGATAGENSLSLNTTTRGTAISVLGDLTVTGIALTATAGNGPALRANNITISNATLDVTNNSANNAAIQATQGDGPLGNLTVSGTSAITVTNNNANGRAIHATIINGKETPGQTDASQVTISSPAPHSHICSDGWTSDATGHWHRCADANCTEKLNFAAHSGGTATCTDAKKCEICNQSYGEPDPNNHTHLSDWKFDETGHWKACSACSTDIEKTAHTGGAATCTEAKKCEICNQSYGKLDPNNHTHLSDWKFDETGHWKVCADCKAADIDKAIHAYSDWIIDKEATATEAGSRHKVCTICNYETPTETIPATGPCTHEGSAWEPANDGVHHVKKCADCGAEPATEKHNFAYCDNRDGFHSMTCDVCKVSYTQEHDFSYKTVPADGGKHRGQCVCGAFDAAEEHTFENGICTACGAADPASAKPTPGGSGIIITPEGISPEAAGPVFLSGANQTVALGSAAVFRIDYNYAAFRSVAVDGVILDPTSYTTWEGSTWVKLTAACTKSLTPGTHTLSVYFDGATAVTTFTVGGQPNPATGARDAVGIATAAAVIALLGSPVILRKK